MMQKIRFKNYKAFKDWQEIEIKSVTVFIGKNNSGKSAVARLPILLNEAFFKGGKDVPLPLNVRRLEFGIDFTDLIFEKVETRILEFELQFKKLEDEREAFIKVDIQHLPEQETQIISRIEYRWFEPLFSDKAFKMVLKRKFENLNRAQCELSFDDGDIRVINDVIFQGIQLKSNGSYSLVKDLKTKMNEYCENVDMIGDTNISYLGGFRTLPQRIYEKGNFNYSRGVGNKGELAPYFLFRNIGFSKKIGKWYEKNLGGWKLEVNKVSHYYELAFSKKNLKVNWVDSGHGMSQILPVVVQAFKSEKDSINIIEEPELYLHPSAHGTIAELIAEKAIENKSFFMIETHSENFVLRLRRLVAEGKLSPDAVKIYWIDDDVEDGEGHQVKAINIDEKGEVDFWPEGIFSEDYEETLAIRRAQRKTVENQ